MGILVRRGLKNNLPNTAPEGELLVTVDRLNLYLGLNSEIKSLTPDFDKLNFFTGNVQPDQDCLLICDADGIGQKEKKISLEDLRIKMNIPSGGYGYTQATPANIWVINHSLGRLVDTVVYTLAGVKVLVDVENVSLNQSRVIAAYPLSGYAICN